MTDEKMIEEMVFTEVDILSNDLNLHCVDLAENYCGGTNCLTCLSYAMIKKGYRKLPENAVVIPEKITEETSPEDIIKIAKYNETIRKETAREIRNAFRELLSQYCENMTRGFAFKILDETIEQCGVKVEK